jgi:natural product precursor
MKTKKFDKKLALGKKTVANLNLKEMKVLKGGGFTDGELVTCFETCPTCNFEVSIDPCWSDNC